MLCSERSNQSICCWRKTIRHRKIVNQLKYWHFSPGLESSVDSSSYVAYWTCMIVDDYCWHWWVRWNEVIYISLSVRMRYLTCQNRRGREFMDNFLYNSIIIQLTGKNLLDSNVDRSLGRYCLRKRSIEHFGKFQLTLEFKGLGNWLLQQYSWEIWIKLRSELDEELISNDEFKNLLPFRFYDVLTRHFPVEWLSVMQRKMVNQRESAMTWHHYLITE